MSDSDPDSVETFIAKWSGVTASELSTAQSFAIDLCKLLGLPGPHPDAEQQYMFERPVTFQHGDGSTSPGRIDLYRRGAFVLESKKLRQGANTKGFDDAMLRARSQAEQYARALPVAEGRPPFLVIVDVGNRIELYSEFSRSGATYTPFPDPRSHRIALADLRDENIRDRLRRIWTDPLGLDPSRESARVTREIAAQLATLARSLEGTHAPETVAQFLMRCLFTMFAEDVRLLPAESFRNVLLKHADSPDVAMRMLGLLWRDMDSGGFSGVLAGDILKFNGKLFKHPDTLPLDKAQLALLIDAARADWKHVEPAIFGTLLERALSPSERHKLGAHYTPRAYVERLVLPTVIEPLRAEWSDTQAAALTLAAEGKADEAVGAIRAFHHRLCTVRVLDPACGSGNFLYVTLEHLKRLEGEVLNALDELGFRQTGLAIDGERADAFGGETVDPHQLLGIELNPRAAAIAEVVLWIGYLQWHFRTRGNVQPPQPVIRDFRNIENRDAVLAYDRIEIVTDECGIPVTRWDGVSMKKSPVTGEDVPDDTKRIELERYVNPRRAVWPQADFVVGNPPFIGKHKVREALGDGYVEALRSAWFDVPDSADFVMYWWHQAAQLTRRGALRRFGFITTNSIRQTFNRRVIENALRPESYKPSIGNEVALSFTRRQGSRADIAFGESVSLVFAIPDHPWVDTNDGAAVRISMTVVELGIGTNIATLQDVVEESEQNNGEVAVSLRAKRGLIHADLTVGAAVSTAQPLRSNLGITSNGVMLGSRGFLVARNALPPEEAAVARSILNGQDILQTARGAVVIDFIGKSMEQARCDAPFAFQIVFDLVKPARDANRRASRRDNWWLFSEVMPRLRKITAELVRYIATPETSKHRVFVFVTSDVIAEHPLIAIGIDSGAHLAVLVSTLHETWSLATGGTLEDRPRYNKSRCFETFPFPVTIDSQKIYLRSIAEQLDAHRKRQQATHPDLTLTGMYNVLERLRSVEVLTAKERVIHEHGLVSVLRQLHDEIDAAVLDAYGWSDLLPLLRIAHGNEPGSGEERTEAKRAFDEVILERLVALNAERAAEEARGLVRWLRPEFQNPSAQTAPEQSELDTGSDEEATTTVVAPTAKPNAWPKDAVEQVRAVADVLAASPIALTLDDIAARFTARGAWKKRLPQLLDMLVALGRAREDAGKYISV